MQNKYKTTIEKRVQRGIGIIDDIEINKFDFENGLVSKDDVADMFTNYVKYETEKCYKLVEEYYIKSLYADYTFINEFELNELTPNDRVDRLLNIINHVQKTKYKNSDLPHILKLNSTQETALHFYIRKNKKNYKLLLIDLYHLGIFGRHIIHGKVKKSSIEKIYKRNKKNTIDLANLKN